MKKFFSVFMIAVCCMALAMPAQAQLIKFGVKGGVNLSKLKFEGMKDNSTGFFFGPMAEITIPVIGLGVDGALLYSQKGDKMEGLDIEIFHRSGQYAGYLCSGRSGLLLQLQG